MIYKNRLFFYFKKNNLAARYLPDLPFHRPVRKTLRVQVCRDNPAPRDDHSSVCLHQVGLHTDRKNNKRKNSSQSELHFKFIGTTPAAKRYMKQGFSNIHFFYLGFQ
jgi:hypothetical protein